jgi:hypothetical protein
MATHDPMSLYVWSGLADYNGTIHRFEATTLTPWEADVRKIVRKAGGYVRSVNKDVGSLDMFLPEAVEMNGAGASHKVAFDARPGITELSHARKETKLLRGDLSVIIDGEYQKPSGAFGRKSSTQPASQAQKAPSRGHVYGPYGCITR